MSYLLRPGFRLEHRVIPSVGKVYFVSSQDGTGKALVLNEVATRLMKVLMLRGRVNTINKPSELDALRWLEYEGVVANTYSQEINEVGSFPVESKRPVVPPVLTPPKQSSLLFFNEDEQWPYQNSGSIISKPGTVAV